MGMGNIENRERKGRQPQKDCSVFLCFVSKVKECKTPALTSRQTPFIFFFSVPCTSGCSELPKLKPEEKETNRTETVPKLCEGPSSPVALCPQISVQINVQSMSVYMTGALSSRDWPARSSLLCPFRRTFFAGLQKHNWTVLQCPGSQSPLTCLSK